MNDVDLSDYEIDNICQGRVQNSAKVRHLKKMGLNVRRKPNGRPLSFEQLRACAAHELGHVLGLDDSPNNGDLMGRMDFNRPATFIRSEEVSMLIDARQEASAIRRTIYKISDRKS